MDSRTRTQGERRSQRSFRDSDETVECAGCDAQPLVGLALGLVILRPGLYSNPSATWWCPRCARRFARCFYGQA
jgi:hypothetical protein